MNSSRIDFQSRRFQIVSPSLRLHYPLNPLIFLTSISKIDLAIRCSTKSHEDWTRQSPSIRIYRKTSKISYSHHSHLLQGNDSILTLSWWTLYTLTWISRNNSWVLEQIPNRLKKLFRTTTKHRNTRKSENYLAHDEMRSDRNKFYFYDRNDAFAGQFYIPSSLIRKGVGWENAK